MEKIIFKFNETDGVRIEQSASLKEKAAKYDDSIHKLPIDFTLRNDFQTLSKLYNSAFCTDNAVFAHEFEKLKAHLLEKRGGGIVFVNGIEEN